MSLLDTYLQARQRVESRRRPRKSASSARPLQSLDSVSPDLWPTQQDARRLERENEAENARQRARREYSPLPDEFGPLVPMTAMVGDFIQAPNDAILAREGDPRAQRRLGERDERWRRGTERAGQDILAEGHGGQLMDWIAGIPADLQEAERARLEAGGENSTSARILSAAGNLWTGMAAAPREARGEVAAQDVIRAQNRSDAEDAMLRGDDVGANRAARSGQMAEQAGNVAAGEDFWYNAPWAAEFIPGVGLLDTATTAGRFGARQGFRAAGQEIPEAIARPNRLSETQRVGPATENARGWRNNAALGGAVYLGADAIDGEMGDDYTAPAIVAGGTMAFGRRFIPGVDNAIAEAPRARRLGQPEALQAQPVPEGAPFGFEGAPQSGRVIDAEAMPAPQRRFEAAVRDPNDIDPATGQVREGAPTYRGEDHQAAIDAIADDAVRARVQAAYDAADENPDLIGFQVDGQFMGREDGLAALRERAGRGRQVRIGEQVNADGSVTPRSEIDWDDPNTRLAADYQEADSLAGMPTGPADRRLGAALAAGGIGGGAVGLALEGEAQADNGSGSDGVPMLPVLGAGAGAATLAALSRGRLGQANRSQVGMFAGVNARTADRAALARAQEMATSGASRESIWRDTGWFQGVDGKWRFEIDDSGARIAPDMVERHSAARVGQSQRRPLTEGLEHPELNAAYDLGDTSLDFGRLSRGAVGEYDNSRRSISMYAADDPDMLRSGTLHEVQHRVQREEGFATGGTPESAWGVNEQASLDAIRAQKKAVLGGRDPYAIQNQIAAGYRVADEDMAALEQWRALTRQEDEILANTLSPREAYRRLGGETEARNVQTRRDFTAEERRSRPPWETQDVPDDQQIIRFDGDRADSVGMSGGRGARRLGAETDLPSDVNPGRSENPTGTGEQRRYRSRNDERNARILALAEELDTYSNRGTGGAGMRRENSTDAIAARMRSEGYGEVSRSTVLGVLKRERDRLNPPAAAGAVDPDVAAAERLGMSVERYRALSARKRNEAIAALGLTGGGAALAFSDEAEAQGFDPNGQWIGDEQRRDLGDRTEIRQRFRDSQGRIFEGVRYQDHATGAISAPQFAPVGEAPMPQLGDTYDASEVPLRPEEIERIQAMRDEEARRLGQAPERRENRAPDETQATTPSWALAAPLAAGVLGGRLGRRLGEEAGRPLMEETAGAMTFGGVVGGASGLATDAQDAGDLATFGTVLGAGGRGVYRLGEEGVRRGAEAVADFRPPAPRRVRGQPLPYVGDDAVAPMSQPGALRPPPARQPDRVSGSLDEGDLSREMSGRAIEEGRRRLRSTPVTMEERLNVPPGERGSLEGRLGTLGAEPLRELARREGLPTEGTVRDLARRLADAARADPARVQRYRDIFQALGVSGVIIGGASQLLPQDAQADDGGSDLPDWADEAGIGAGAAGLALMGRTALPQAVESALPRNARLGQMSRVSEIPMDVPTRPFNVERSRLGRMAPGSLDSDVDPLVVAGASALAAGPVAWGAAELIDPYAESPQEQEARFMRDVLPYLELQQQALRLHARGVRSNEVVDPELVAELQRLEAGGSEGARRLGVRSEAAPPN